MGLDLARCRTEQEGVDASRPYLAKLYAHAEARQFLRRILLVVLVFTASACAGNNNGVPNPTDVYIAATGSDTRGNGSSGNPYATLAKAVSVLTQPLSCDTTIHVADGTYTESLSVDTITAAGRGRLIIQGDTTTPANVVFASANGSFGGNISGPVTVLLEGLKIQPSVSTVNGLQSSNFSRLEIDKTIVGGKLTNGVVVSTASVAFYGDLTVSGWSAVGLLINNNSMATTNASNITITLSGPGGTLAKGLVLTASRWFTFSDVSSINLTITDTWHAIESVLTSMFAFSTSGTITATNASTPANSAAIYESDASSVGINTGASTVFDHWTWGFNAGSLSYGEDVPESGGTRTWTNIGSNSLTTNGAVVHLP